MLTAIYLKKIYTLLQRDLILVCSCLICNVIFKKNKSAVGNIILKKKQNKMKY